VSTTLTPRAGAATAPDRGPYLQAFCSAAGAEAFHSIVGPNEIWKADPFDVEAIHADARDLFDRLLNRAMGDPRPDQGRVLLLLGESGSGKTHLMRAFRHTTHVSDRGYCGYLQMTSVAVNYARYVLSKLIDSLDQPYCDPDNLTSGLMRLSTGLLEAAPQVPSARREQLRERDGAELHDCVYEIADQVVLNDRFAGCDLGVIRALLYLQRNDPRIKLRALSYLRCEDLAPPDRAVLGGIVPRCQEEDPQRVIIALGRLMAAVHNAGLVLLVDQLEEIFNLDNTGVAQFRRAVDALTAIGEAVPTSVVVIACLEDYFVQNEQHLPRPKLDRLRTDPEPVRLSSLRDRDEVTALVGQRLRALYDEEELPVNDLPPTFPFRPDGLAALANMRTRDVLTHCLRHQQRCAVTGTWSEPNWGHGGRPDEEREETKKPDVTGLEQQWNDFLAAARPQVPEDEPLLADLLRWAVERVSNELTTGHRFSVDGRGKLIPITIEGPGNALDKVLAAVCNRDARGGGLGTQISEAEKEAGEIVIALVRSTAFPASPATKVGKQIGGLVKRGGRLVSVEDAEWRKILALQQFHKGHGSRPDYCDWLQQGRPLSQLPSLRRLLALDQLAISRPAASEPPAPPAERPPTRTKPAGVPKPEPAPVPVETGLLLVGWRVGVTGGTVALECEELKQHAAFLGASGSGKTTTALHLVEQLLLRGTPAILVDRKGDLCRYADPSAWEDELADPAAVQRRQRLRDRVEVAVYTPGHPEGRSLTLPVVPEGIDQLPTAEREQLAGYAAAALAGMLGYTSRGQTARLAILRKAIEVLAGMSGVCVTVAALRDLVEARDEALLAAVGGFDDRQYRQLAADLLALRINQRRLLEGDGEPLDIDALLGRGRPTGRTRLSVISTRFLGDAATVEFWVAQLLAALNRWAGKSPCASLQAVVLFDEADLYLPAVRQPATKAPMESLLRRARSAGLGVLLATQSPGDFDYKCRDNIKSWLVGQVKEETALRKLKPMFSEVRLDPAARLPGQGTGQFHLLRGKEVVALRSQPSLIRTEQLPEERIQELARSTRR
jgi:energy-coupling factor transporter ATP-binding protein EcfA2